MRNKVTLFDRDAALDEYRLDTPMTLKCASSDTSGASQYPFRYPLGAGIHRKSYCRPLPNQYDAGSDERIQKVTRRHWHHNPHGDALTNEGRCDVQTRFRRLYIETDDGSVKLDILGERATCNERDPGDRAKLNARLHQAVTASARLLGTGCSSASSQSRCSMNPAGTARWQGSAQATDHRGQRRKIDIEGD